MPLIYCNPYQAASGPGVIASGTASMLIHFDGANGSTTIVDEMKARTWTRSGTPSITTTNKKIGTSSLAALKTGHYSTPYDASLVFGTGDFTVETWVNVAADVIYGGIVCGTYVTGLFRGWALSVNSTADNHGVALSLWGSNPSSSTAQAENVILRYRPKLILNTWYHIAVTRKDGLVTIWLNGQPVASKTLAIDENYVGPFRIGSMGNYEHTPYNGHIDEMRIVKGTAVYTEAFTPPTTPFTA